MQMSSVRLKLQNRPRSFSPTEEKNDLMESFFSLIIVDVLADLLDVQGLLGSLRLAISDDVVTGNDLTIQKVLIHPVDL